MHALDDTIAAVASAPGAGVRAILRVSGPESRRIVGGCVSWNDPRAWETARLPRRHLGQVQLPGWRAALRVEVLLWPTGRSYTGQPLVEIHLPGSPPLVDALLTLLYARGAQPAQAGEFTLRAFLAGRVDLVQAEAVLGVIDASDDHQLRVALEQLAGGLSGRIAQLREDLLLHLADLEAGLDFVEEDIEFVSRPELERRLTQAVAELSRLEAQAAGRLESRPQPVVVLAGLPNAGKSTLYNALLERETAIVSARPGTTRDVLNSRLDCDGLQVIISDTAGWDDSEDALDAAAGRQREEQLRRADLILWCTASNLSPDDRLQDEFLRSQLPPGVDVLPVRTKSDLAAGECAEVTVSARQGRGLVELKQRLAARLESAALHRGELVASTAARCQESLSRARSALAGALEAARAGAGDELIAAELRLGLDQLGLICGAVYTDDILDRIFSRFCIGK